MGIFGGIGKKLTAPGFGDRLLAAGAIVNGDFGTAGQIRALGQQRRDERAQAEAQAQQHEQLIAAAVQLGIPEQTARSVPPQTLAQAVGQRMQPQGDDAFERALRGAGIDPASPQGKSLYAQRAATMASPAPQMVGNPEQGYQFITPPAPQMPGMGGQQGANGAPQPGAVVGGYRFKGGNPNDRNSWEPAGGGSGNAASNFPGFRRLSNVGQFRIP